MSFDSSILTDVHFSPPDLTITKFTQPAAAKNHSTTTTQRIDTPNDNLQRKETNSSRPTLLFYGFEIAYLFPIDLYKRAALSKNNTAVFSALTNTALRKLVQKLKAAGVRAAFPRSFKKPVPSHKWKLQRERHGFEIASPLAPSFDEIRVVLSVLKDFGCFVHPNFTAMHINIDAHDRSMMEMRNVYKNLIAVEGALDLLRFTNQSAKLGGAADGMVSRFNSTRQAYESLDDTTSFQSLLGLGLKESNMTKLHPMLRSSYKVGMRLKENGTLPRTIEFRGLEASLDPSVPISWLKLCMRLIQMSYTGHVLQPLERSTSEAWSSLFEDLVHDHDHVLQEYFLHRTNVIKVAHEIPDVLEFNANFGAYRRMKTRDE
jgi:hypothetical protein